MLIRRVADGRGRVIREGVPHVRRETVSPQLARMMTEMLTAVTEEGGTAVEAAVPGFRVAGKTGTAQKADPATGKYSVDHFTASSPGSSLRRDHASSSRSSSTSRPSATTAATWRAPSSGEWPRRASAISVSRRRWRSRGRTARVNWQTMTTPRPPSPRRPASSTSELGDDPRRRAGSHPRRDRPRRARRTEAHGRGRTPAADRGFGSPRPPEPRRPGAAAAKGSTVRLVFEPAS